MSESCENLVKLAQGGSPEAFDRLVSLHQARVFATAFRMLDNYEDAADIQQETFVRAWQNLRKFRRQAAFSTWLHRIAVNLCMSQRRKRSPVFVEEIHPPSMDCGDDRQKLADLRRVLAAMPRHHRALLVLRDMEGRSFEEIASILGCSVESARSRLCRARKLLRERMQPYMEDLE